MKNECDYTLFKCGHCSLELYRNEYYEHAVNCNNVMNSLEYVANKRNVSKEKEWNDVIKDLPELKETSFISLFKLLMHQINVNNEKINNRFDVITNELKEIHEDIDRVCKNNMIFFESINTELENINNKINSNNDININNETLTSLPLDGNADNTMRKFPTMTTSNNNSLLSEHNSSVGGSNSNNNVTSISNSNNGKIKNNKYNKVKMLQIGKNGTSGVIKRKSCSPRNNNNNNSNSSNNNSANKEKDKDGYCPPHSKPFNTFTGFTNSNLVCIIHNQETIISKLTKIEKNQESNKNEIVKEIKEKEENLSRLVVEKIEFVEDEKYGALKKVTYYEADTDYTWRTITYERYGSTTGWAIANHAHIDGGGPGSMICAFDENGELDFKRTYTIQGYGEVKDCYVRVDIDLNTNIETPQKEENIYYNSQEKRLYVDIENAEMIMVYDAVGKNIITKEVDLETKSISLNLNSGIYIVMTKNGNRYAKIVVK